MSHLTCTCTNFKADMIGETCFLYHRQLISYPTLLPSSKSSKNNQKATITVVVIQNGWVTSSSIRNVTACYGIINLSTELIQETEAHLGPVKDL